MIVNPILRALALLSLAFSTALQDPAAATTSVTVPFKNIQLEAVFEKAP